MFFIAKLLQSSIQVPVGRLVLRFGKMMPAAVLPRMLTLDFILQTGVVVDVSFPHAEGSCK